MGGDMPDALQGGNATIYLFPAWGGTRWLAVLVGHQLPVNAFSVSMDNIHHFCQLYIKTT